MSDGDTPKPPRRPTRGQSQTERDVESYEKKKERDSGLHETIVRRDSPGLSEAIPRPFEGEDVTGNYEGEELRARRSRRPTGERLNRLEDKHDALVLTVGETRDMVLETRGDVREIHGELKVLPDLMSLVRGVAQGAQERNHVTVTTKLDVEKAREEAKIEIEKAEALTGLEIAQAKELDGIKARADRRKLVTKWVGAIVGMPALWELIKLIARSLRG